MNKITPLIVTRHPALIEWLASRGVTGETIAHASEEAITGRVTVGVLPPALMSVSAVHVNVDMRITPDMRGRELSLTDIEGASPHAVAYCVTAINGAVPTCKIGRANLEKAREIVRVINGES